MSATSAAFIRSGERFAWHGQSLLVTTDRGDCGSANSLTGYYFREARYLRAIRLAINGAAPWLCESAAERPESLHFSYIHPELVSFGGGGSGQSQDDVSRDGDGIPHRSLAAELMYEVGIASLEVRVRIANHAREPVTFELAWMLDADYADLQEGISGNREQQADVRVEVQDRGLRFSYAHPDLAYHTSITTVGDAPWRIHESSIATTLSLGTQQTIEVGLAIRPENYRGQPEREVLGRAEARWRSWRDDFARVGIAGNRVAQEVVQANLSDLASFPLLQGPTDEQLAPQAGIPLYPALFGRDAFTAGWQAAWVDGGRMLDASLTRLGRMQSTRFDDWHDEEPGRIPYQVRQGPLAQLDLNPYAAYYADFASPMMFIISLAHCFAWSGDRAMLDRHWDVARRILDWLNERGDRDGDGYLEYLTKSSKGTKNQGWKDSGNAVLYEDGSPVPAPLGTCELQGYWFAALQMMAAMSWLRGERDDARGLWHQAMDLKERFNRDWWMEDRDFFALALDPSKRQVRALTSNVGQCIATGIIDDEHLPRVVGRLFAPDMFSGWGIRTLSSDDPAYNPLEYHLGSVWAVENATIAFGLARFGFRERAAELAEGLFALARLYPGYRIPETVGGYARGRRPFPGAYPRSNTVQLWNATVFPLLLQSLLGMEPLAPYKTLVVDPHLPDWLPDVTIDGLRVGDARFRLRVWRDPDGDCHAETSGKTGTVHLVRQPPIESLFDGLSSRIGALAETIAHH